MHIQPYLNFNGRADEAIEFYKRALGATVVRLMRYKDNPQPGMGQPGIDPEKVMHAELRIGETIIMLSDGGCREVPPFEGVSLVLFVPDAAAAEQAFAALSEGGEAQMPLTKTFFSPSFGMAADRFGMSWMIFAGSGSGTGAAAASDNAFVISRTFKAPRELVWKAWTERGALVQWWGPKGFDIGVADLDFRPGGAFHYSMRTPDSHEMWGKFAYHDIAAPDWLVFSNSFSDKGGGVTRHPMCANWPLEVSNVLTLEERDGKTTLTLRGVPRNASEEERKTFDQSHNNLREGFAGTFDRLEEYLAKS
jgi:uncharacterized glyoxalase superfamily protein PhnB/uncharacterized protein YndB with AHSA1/START domain